MADAKKATIVIKKVKKGGHAAPHGGAWKVAYADFVTAMMCFFLVMWLMGTDEETKAAISAYFNNPSSPEVWRPDLHDVDARPMGNKTGAGESILKGAEGAIPEDLVQRPSPILERKPDSAGPSEAKGTFSSEDLAAAETLTFVLFENQLFRLNSMDLAQPQAKAALEQVGRIAKSFRGSLVIQSSYNPAGGSPQDSYEFAMSRLVELKRFFVDHRWLAEELISVKLEQSTEPSERRFVFSFSKSSQ
jgi:chemotaxis protein MotB